MGSVPERKPRSMSTPEHLKKLMLSMWWDVKGIIHWRSWNLTKPLMLPPQLCNQTNCREGARICLGSTSTNVKEYQILRVYPK